MLDVIARIHFTRDKIIEEMKPIEHFEYVQYSPMKRHPKIRFRLNCDTVVAAGSECGTCC